jgi:hypothetical protein
MKRRIKFLAIGLGTLSTLWIFSAKGDDEPKPPSLEEQKKEYAERIHSSLLMERKLLPNWYSTTGKIIPKREFKRPAGTDEVGWDYALLMLELAIHENQPVKFSGRIVDENAKAVGGAKIELKLSGFNTEQLLDKFPYIDPGETHTNWTITLTSDQKGWIEFEQAACRYLSVCKVSKTGFTAQENLGEIEYTTRIECATQSELAGQYKKMTNGGPLSCHIKIISGNIDTNAANPNKGFTLVLKKQLNLQ